MCICTVQVHVQWNIYIKHHWANERIDNRVSFIHVHVHVYCVLYTEEPIQKFLFGEAGVSFIKINFVLERISTIIL